MFYVLTKIIFYLTLPSFAIPPSPPLPRHKGIRIGEFIRVRDFVSQIPGTSIYRI
jgi:hypothetical protein